MSKQAFHNCVTDLIRLLRLSVYSLLFLLYALYTKCVIISFVILHICSQKFYCFRLYAEQHFNAYLSLAQYPCLIFMLMFKLSLAFEFVCLCETEIKH